MAIVYSRSSLKFLKKQNAEDRNRIVAAIENLPNGNVKKLQGIELYRLRVGDFRVVYNSDGVVLTVVKIASRGQIYK